MLTVLTVLLTTLTSLLFPVRLTLVQIGSVSWISLASLTRMAPWVIIYFRTQN